MAFLEPQNVFCGKVLACEAKVLPWVWSRAYRPTGRAFETPGDSYASEISYMPGVDGITLVECRSKPYSRSPEVGNLIASILKEQSIGNPRTSCP